MKKKLERMVQRGFVSGALLLWFLVIVSVTVALSWSVIPFWLRHAVIGVLCGAGIFAGALIFSVVVVWGAYDEVSYGRKLTDQEETAAVWYGSLYTAIVYAAGVFAYVHWARLTKFFDA